MSSTKKLTTIAILSAMAMVLNLLIQFPIVPAVSFLSYDPKDIIIVIAGFIYGLFFYGCNMKVAESFDGDKKGILKFIDVKFLLRCILALTVETLLVNVLLGTYWCSIMYGKGFAFYLSIRFAKNMIQLPINIILTYYVLGFIKYINNKIYE